MVPSYVQAGFIYLLLFLSAGIVSIFRTIRGTFSKKGIMIDIAGLSLLELSAYISILGSFCVIGGPDPSSQIVGLGLICIAVSLVVALIALHLLSIPYFLVALFLVSPVVTFFAQKAVAFDLAVAAFTTGPLFCLFVIVIFWVVRNPLMNRLQIEQR